jgi:hypothetical protein
MSPKFSNLVCTKNYNIVTVFWVHYNMQTPINLVKRIMQNLMITNVSICVVQLIKSGHLIRKYNLPMIFLKGNV